MTAWGLCMTVKAPVDQVLAFVAHHLNLGAAHIWVHFDDPDDPAADRLSGLPQVTVRRCDEAHWAATAGRRPDKHQNRQGRNMQRVYAETDLPFLAHVDVDEFILADRPVAEVLAGHPADRPILRMAPWEALHDPDLPDDIFTARHFRAAMRGEAAADQRRAVFGRYAPLMPMGVLSHAVGKCFFRTGIAGLEPRLHGGFLNGQRLQGGGFNDALHLLHFHAQDPEDWKGKLKFRLTRGAYHFNLPLQAHLQAADDREVAAFYRKVQTATDKALTTLAGHGLLKRADLKLRAQVARMMGQTA